MATISEDYVSFETAKLLNEKGFDVPCMGRYSVRSKEFHFDCTRLCNNGGLFECSAPTLQMAMKWLREVHNWTICISPYWPEGDMRNKLTWYYCIHSLINNRSFRESSYTDNYTKACEAAIKYCLENLI